ncbi:hypothetical protein HK102_002172 [Quaeritorhiza haematococci]|nr:hypothetical protein HK102_002172 [Quaeritorhiza haematococci]
MSEVAQDPNKTLTENAFTAYKSTLDHRLDFFYLSPSAHRDNIVEALRKCWRSHPKDTLKLIFQLRDDLLKLLLWRLRHGKRKLNFFTAFLFSAAAFSRSSNRFASASACSALIRATSSGIGMPYAHVLHEMFELRLPPATLKEDKVATIFADALKADVEALSKKKVGFVCGQLFIAFAIAKKLVPRNATESDDEYKIRALNEYRTKYYVPLRAATPALEAFMSARKWDQIQYNPVTSICMKQNKK